MTVQPSKSKSGTSNGNPYSALPQVNEVVERVQREGASTLSSEYLIRAVQDEIAHLRAAIAGGEVITREEAIDRTIAGVASLERSRLTRSLNATGILIHTNIGRAAVSAETSRAMTEAASSSVPLEIDPETNTRGGRMDEISALMHLLTGAESTQVVNNNAAAVLLVLTALTSGREVIVSRGEAIEIGGGFRIPDVLRQSGATLVEVGTTNRTYPADYEGAVNANTTALLKIHPSNFSITGFVRSASIDELVPIARSHGIALLDDLGSGALLDTSDYGLAMEPTIQGSLAAGADIVTASGDKLIGGPQGGFICGSRRLVVAVSAHPLARAVRADKTCLAGMAATLRHYARGEAMREIPVWRMIAAQAADLHSRAETVGRAFRNDGHDIEVVQTRSTTGGGSLPGQTLESWGVSIRMQSGSHTEELAKRLRTGDPRVFSTVQDNRVVLDMRSVLPEDDEQLIRAIWTALQRE